MVLKRYIEALIVVVLQEAEAGSKVAQLCRRHATSEATYYVWKTKYAGMTVSELRRLKSLAAENRRLKQIFAEQALDNVELLAMDFCRLRRPCWAGQLTFRVTVG